MDGGFSWFYGEEGWHSLERGRNKYSGCGDCFNVYWENLDCLVSDDIESLSLYLFVT